MMVRYLEELFERQKTDYNLYMAQEVHGGAEHLRKVLSEPNAEDWKHIFDENTELRV